MLEKLFYLIPKTINQKDFNKRALVKMINNSGDYALFSYLSFVAFYHYKTGEIYLNKTLPARLLYSATTLKHIKEFYYQFKDDSKKLNKKDIEKLPPWTDGVITL